jgi:hypothetical protein
LDESRTGGYAGPPWIFVCIVPVYDGSYAVPLPMKSYPGFDPMVNIQIVNLVPIPIPIAEEMIDQ